GPSASSNNSGASQPDTTASPKTTSPAYAWPPSASGAECRFNLSLWGYTTKRDLSGFGTFLVMGLFGLIVAMLLNTLFFRSGEMDLIVSVVGVLIFAGLTAYDTQKIKLIYDQVAGTEYQGRAVVMGALTLYLDFINMFLFLLRLFGSARD
ncbi:Bax inhibitor-1/YccA family protein, partial [Sphingomonas canadensis]